MADSAEVMALPADLVKKAARGIAASNCFDLDEVGPTLQSLFLADARLALEACGVPALLAEVERLRAQVEELSTPNVFGDDGDGVYGDDDDLIELAMALRIKPGEYKQLPWSNRLITPSWWIAVLPDSEDPQGTYADVFATEEKARKALSTPRPGGG